MGEVFLDKFHCITYYIYYYYCTTTNSALSLSGEEVEETELPGLAVDYQTFFCANVIENCIIQVIIQSSILLFSQLHPLFYIVCCV